MKYAICFDCRFWQENYNFSPVAFGANLRSSQFIAIGRHLIFPIDIQIDATPLLLNKYSQK
jgi:hypothetical protein